MLCDSEGHSYVIKKVKISGEIIWRCSFRQPHCPVTIEEDEAGLFTVHGVHIAHPQKNSIEKQKIFDKVILSNMGSYLT